MKQSFGRHRDVSWCRTWGRLQAAYRDRRADYPGWAAVRICALYMSARCQVRELRIRNFRRVRGRTVLPEFVKGRSHFQLPLQNDNHLKQKTNMRLKSGIRANLEPIESVLQLHENPAGSWTFRFVYSSLMNGNIDANTKLGGKPASPCRPRFPYQACAMSQRKSSWLMPTSLPVHKPILQLNENLAGLVSKPNW